MTRRDFTKGLFVAGLSAGLPVIGRADGTPSAAAVRAGRATLPEIAGRRLEFTHFLSVEMRRTRMDKG